MSAEQRALLTSLRKATGAVLIGNYRDAIFWIEDAKGKAVEMRKPPITREETLHA